MEVEAVRRTAENAVQHNVEEAPLEEAANGHPNPRLRIRVPAVKVEQIDPTRDKSTR